MSEEEIYKIALQIATDAHAGQKDMGGCAYIEHPLAVSALCRSRNAKIAALLHDVIEDTDVTAEDLRARGIPEDIVHAVVLVTKTADYDEQRYFEGIKADPIAREVKMADLLHNMDPERPLLPEKTAHIEKKRRQYYREFLFLYRE